MTNFRRLTVNEYEIEFCANDNEMANSKSTDKKMKTSKKHGKKAVVDDEPAHEIVSRNEEFVEIKTAILETQHEIIEKGDPQNLTIDIFAVSDEGKYECDIKDIQFADTPMFQSSTHSFTVKNVSGVTLEYCWNIKTSFNDNTITNEDMIVFKIDPEIGSIPPKSNQEFLVTFSPQNAGQYKCELQPTISPLNDEQSSSPFIIPIKCKCIPTVCYFDFAQFEYYKTYITDGKRNPNMTGPSGKPGEPLPTNIAVLHRKSLGVKVKNRLHFTVLNTMDHSYEFKWNDTQVPNGWKCLTTNGCIQSGDKYTMLFEYKPKTTIILESFWNLEIVSENYVQHFMLVGSVFEPDVRLSHSNVRFMPQLVSTSTSQTVSIENTEDTSFEWWIDRNLFMKSLIKYRTSDGQKRNSFGKTGNERLPLVISDFSGVIDAHSNESIQLTFNPLLEMQYNFKFSYILHMCICLFIYFYFVCNIISIEFHVKSKPGVSMLNVKGEGFMLHPQIEFIDNKTIINVQSKRLTPINFGQLHIKQTKTKTFIIYNKSDKYPFDFHWRFLWSKNSSTTKNHKLKKSFFYKNSQKSNTFSFSPRKKAQERQCLTIHPSQGTIAPQHSIECQLVFCSKQIITIDEQKLLRLEIGGKNIVCNKDNNYLFSILAKARKPRIEFIPNKMINFGDCFLFHTNSDPLLQTLIIKNKENVGSITADVIFDNKSYLEISPIGPIIIEAKKQIKIEIIFRPQNTQKYNEKLLLNINNLFTHEIHIKGKGINLKIDIENKSQRSLSFGNLRIGQIRTKKIPIINYSKKTSVCNVSLDSILSENYVTLDAHSIEKFRLRPNEKHMITLTCHPSMSLTLFEGNLLLNSDNKSYILSTVRGKCYGISTKLDNDTLSYGTVIAGSSKILTTKLYNTSDIGIRYQWNTKCIKPHFSLLSSVCGYIEENNYSMVEICFKPNKTQQNICINNIPCYITCDNKQHIQHLSLIGSCINQPKGKTLDLHFTTNVRTKCEQKIEIKNDTNEDWHLQPTIQNSYWTGKHSIHVPQQSLVNYSLMYHPLLMTADDNHNGNVFFPLPNGTAIAYNLIGIANEPNIENEINIETSAKHHTTIILNVRNWLNCHQRFHVQIIKNEIEEEFLDTIFIKNVEWIDISSMNERNYRLSFYSLKCNPKITFYVKFLNKENSEYLLYKINVNVSSVMVNKHEAISLQSTIRQRLVYQLSIANPLNISAVIHSYECKSEHIFISELPFKILANSTKTLPIYYRPLSFIQQSQECILTLSSKELGEYKYMLRLCSTTIGVEKVLKFHSVLGAENMQTFHFKHYGNITMYDIAIVDENDESIAECDFSVSEKQMKVSNVNENESVSLSLDVRYIPSEIGSIRNLLVITSAVNKCEYRCALQGFCDLPKPKGPFLITSGEPNLQIPFCNPYQISNEFLFQTDCRCFVLKKKMENIKAKQKIMIHLVFNVDDELRLRLKNNGSNEIMGKLIVKSAMKHEWIFYIRGVIQ